LFRMLRSALSVSGRVASSGVRALSNSSVANAKPSKEEVSEVFQDNAASSRRHAFSLNRVELIGGVAEMPRKMVAKNGKDYVMFNVITNLRNKTSTGEVVDRADRHSVTAFGRLAEIVEEKVAKGTRVLVHGRLHQSGGVLQEDGNRTPRQTYVQAETVQLLAKGGDRF
ncbi:hypothetical protein PFISCL1PPCAC_9095, partial [Pristionchus fissidentatus]